MKYRYVAAYKLIGVTRPADGEEQVLVEYPGINARALIICDVDGHLLELDKATAIGSLMLAGVFGPGSKGTFEERLAHKLEELRETRKKVIGQGVFVIFEAEGEVESFAPRNEREMPDFVVAIEGTPKQPIRRSYQAPINGLLASFALGSDQICGVKKVTDDVIFVREDGKPVYSYKFETTGKGFVSTGLMEDTITFVRNCARVLGRHQGLVDSARLLSRSLETDSDDLQSFLSVWAGLEIFLNRTFREFEEGIFEKLNGRNTTPAPAMFLQRIKRVMKDKYRLADKFAVVSFELSPDKSEEDIERFEEIKKVRDDFVHGRDIAGSVLPTEDAGRLLRKYLKLHAKRVAA